MMKLCSTEDMKRDVKEFSPIYVDDCLYGGSAKFEELMEMITVILPLEPLPLTFSYQVGRVSHVRARVDRKYVKTGLIT